MLAIFVLGAVVLVVLIWAGRRPARVARPRQMLRAFFATLAAAAAVVVGLRGIWEGSLALVVLSLWLGWGQRRVARPPFRVREPMGVTQARSILGVGERAGPAEIEAAYRRLIRRAHPDQGGSTGLAAELNAARDLLLKG